MSEADYPNLRALLRAADTGLGCIYALAWLALWLVGLAVVAAVILHAIDGSG